MARQETKILILVTLGLLFVVRARQGWQLGLVFVQLRNRARRFPQQLHESYRVRIRLW